ncbi:hypothetical protein D1007_05333 [Hordeum vulgare]|nr:hypothetical protein D1007_05333 [Hordeum vulgare]
MKIEYEKESSAHVLPAACTADMAVYNALFLSCFATLVCCVVQACCVTFVMWIIGPKKILDELPASSVKWCRVILFTGVVFTLLSFICLISILDNFIFVRVSLFSCLVWPAKVLLIVGDAVLVLVAVAIVSSGAYITLHCN